MSEHTQKRSGGAKPAPQQTKTGSAPAPVSGISGEEQENPRVRRMKKIAAWAGIIILAVVYLTTFIVGITGAGNTPDLLIACLACTVLVPVVMYAMILAAKRLSKQS